jgi:hypothetical protein
MMWCVIGEHIVPRNTFTRPASGLESTEICNPCYFEGLDQEDEDSEEDTRSRASSVTSFQLSRRDLFGPGMSMSPSQGRSRSQSPASVRELDTADPLIAFDKEQNLPEAPALSGQDWQYLKDFQARLEKEVILTHCTRCKETWFNNNVVAVSVRSVVHLATRRRRMMSLFSCLSRTLWIQVARLPLIFRSSQRSRSS